MIPAYRPDTLSEALEIREQWPVIPMAGGTDLMVQALTGSGVPVSFPRPVLFLSHLASLGGVGKEGENTKIGGATSLAALLTADLPVPFRRAIASMASPALRNVATLGGNVCNGSPCADTLPYLYCADAFVVLRSRTRIRRVAIHDFITGPGSTGLGDNELLTAVQFRPPSYTHFNYRKIGSRRANTLTKLSFLGLALFHEENVSDIRFSFGSVAPTVVRSRNIEEEIIGENKHHLRRCIEDIVRILRSPDQTYR